MTTTLSLHQNKFEPSHLDYIRNEKPTVDLILNPSDGQAQLVKDTSPNTSVITRIMEWNDDAHIHNMYLQGNPEQAGESWAQTVLARRGRMGKYAVLINEPPCNPDSLAKQARAEIAFMKALDRSGTGIKAGIGTFSGGNLQHPSIDGGAEIRAYAPALEYAKANGHALFIHLYFVRPAMGGTTPSGKVHNPYDLAFRWRQSLFPYMRANGIPIPDTYVTEYGLDLGFAKSLYDYVPTNQGVGYKVDPPWGYGTSEQGMREYASDLVTVANEIGKDPEIKGFCIFCAGDNGDERWRSFMVDGYLLSHLQTIALPQPTTTTPPTGGLQVIDLPSNHSSSRAGHQVKYIVLHSTATPQGGTLASTANYLKQNDRGVSIHELVGANTVYRMVPDDKAAHHCESDSARLPNGEPSYLNNELTWGIEAFQIADTPVASDVARTMLARVVEACRRLRVPSARVISHAEMDPTRRSDPVGVNMAQFRIAVANALGETSTPTWTKSDAGTAVWYNEQLARALRGDENAKQQLINALNAEPKRQGLHNVIVAKALPPLVAERDK